MTKEILYTTALDDKDDLVHINDAQKGGVYKCPSCKGKFILRKSGKTRKGSKRPHFAHNQLTSNCTAESALHYSFKKDLTNLLNGYISEKKGLIINWNCTSCSDYNSGNLLAKITSVREEYNLKVCQPDIALLDSDDNVIAVIEIVVTHKPEEKVLHFYQDNGIIHIQINLTSDEDLKNMERKISTPCIVDYCLSPICTDYNRYRTSRRILTYTENCGICYRPIERYSIEVNSAFGKQRSLDFTEEEINLVKSNRTNIEVKTNTLTNEKYPISKCQSCRVLRSRNRSNRL